VKVLNPPGSGKDIAKIKVVVGDCESEGRWRQISGLTNRNLIRLWMRVRLQYKSKPNSYTESLEESEIPEFGESGNQPLQCRYLGELKKRLLARA